MSRAFAIVIGAFFAVNLNAATFRLEQAGKPLPGGEVCLFDAKSLDGPLERLTTFHMVECFPAEGDVPLRAGSWNVFARNPEGFISHDLLLARDGRVDGDRRVIKLERAGRARLAFTPGKGEHVAVYVESTGLVVAAVPGERELLLPLDSPLFPIVIVGGVIRSIGPEFVVTNEAPASVPRPAAVADRVDFAIGVVADREAFARIPAVDRSPGEIRLTEAGGRALPTANRVDLVFEGEDELALFRGVPARDGEGSVGVVGHGWSSVGGALEAFRTEGPLRVAPTTTVAVRWSVNDDVLRLTEQLQTTPCPRYDAATARALDFPDAPQTGLTLMLAQCTALRAGSPARSVRLETCKGVSSSLLDEGSMAGTEVLNDVAPGVYLLRLGYATLPAAFETIQVADADERAAIELKFDRWFGKVTRGGEPIHARVGIGDGAVTDRDTGEYFTVSIPVPPPPPDVAARLFSDPPPIAVQGCDSEVDVLFAPDDPPVPNTRFDIDIEPNVVKVEVIDSGSSKPVADAVIEVGVIRRDHPDSVLFGGAIGKSDDTGSATIPDLPPHREIEVCASRDDYHRRCAERFTLATEREKSVTVALDRADRHAGKVFHPAVGGGRVIWYSLDGRNLESATIEADGAFSYKQPHAPGEVVCVVSAAAPLLVLRQPYLGDDEPFDIRYPTASVRSFNVALSAGARETKGFLSLSIGDIVVPLGVLSEHLRPRGFRPLFLAPGAIAVRDIVASGPVSFIFAPMSWAETYGKETSIDFFYLPAAGSLPRVAAGSDANVVVGD